MDVVGRIAELEAEVAAKDARIAEQDARIAEQDARIAEQDARIAELSAQVAALMAQVQTLTERLGRNSGNSNKPPSSDPPSVRAERRGKSGRGRRRGGQPGHRGSQRALLPPEQVDEFVELYPTQCENCWGELPKTSDPGARPQRHQTTEIPKAKPRTTEHRVHAVVCPDCKHRTWGPHDQVPSSPFGPRLSSVAAALTGVYHLSRRTAVELLHELCGVQMSLGALSAVEARVSEAVKPAVDEAWQQVRAAEVKHTDGTSWFQAGVLCSLWTVASAAATTFKIVKDGKKETLRTMFEQLFGVLVSDRATALGFWAMEQRQICWAHLLRKFASFAERKGRTAEIGRELLDYAAIVFAYWHDFKDGKLSRTALRELMEPLRPQLELLLQRAVAADLDEVSGSCADILEHKAALWTFVEQPGVEPTNNHAERELRRFVLWRKRSFGTQSERGNRFAERLMTVAHTARKQGKNVLAFLTECCIAARTGVPPPSLLSP